MADARPFMLQIRYRRRLFYVVRTSVHDGGQLLTFFILFLDPQEAHEILQERPPFRKKKHFQTSKKALKLKYINFRDLCCLL